MGNVIKRQTHKFSLFVTLVFAKKISRNDIASANFGVKLHGIFYLFLTKSGAFAKTGRQRVGHCQRNIIFQILKVIRNTLFTLDFLITPNITI